MPMASTPRSTPRSTPKKKPTRADRAQEVALYRYALIRPLADPALSASERGKLVRRLACRCIWACSVSRSPCPGRR